ncbi:unnamed protein product [Eruca vesicaria subsp. sativa]|uniref:Uncharacterized protein n=1 Tax=Eruca vesicaria subsp. sativa TaxID=29727 RepID=A0ABC8KQ03_ERUVS|nr:unnamed protein product [Eruca vesicaria subsp. sativa]
MAKAIEQKKNSGTVEETKLDIRDVVTTTYGGRRNDVVMVVLRAMCMVISVVSLLLMAGLAQ